MLEYRDGDGDAFEVLYARHKGPLFRYCLRHCRERSTAEETFQDVWMRVIGARERYQPRAKFTTWLYRIAHNRVIDRYRADNPGRLESLEDDESGMQPAANPVDEPERRVSSGQQAARLHTGLGGHERVEGVRVGVSALAADDDFRDARAAPLHLPCDIQIRRLGEDQSTFGMVDKIFELVARRRHVCGYDDGANLGRREPQQQKLDTVAEMQIDLVTTADAERSQRVCRSIDAFVEIRVAMAADGSVDVIEEHERRFRIRFRAVLQNFRQSATTDRIHWFQAPPDPFGDSLRLLDNADIAQAFHRARACNRRFAG